MWPQACAASTVITFDRRPLPGLTAFDAPERRAAVSSGRRQEIIWHVYGERLALVDRICSEVHGFQRLGLLRFGHTFVPKACKNGDEVVNGIQLSDRDLYSASETKIYLRASYP